MKKTNWVLLPITLLLEFMFLSSCFLYAFIPAPKRTFLPEDLLIAKEDISPEWMIYFGPNRIRGDTGVPPGSMEIALTKTVNATRWDLIEYSYIYPSIEDARYTYSYIEEADLHEVTEIEQWSFISSIADGQMFSCYTFRNMDYPQCTWLVRYQEIIIEMVAFIEPGKVSISEMQNFAKMIDKKVIDKLGSD